MRALALWLALASASAAQEQLTLEDAVAAAGKESPAVQSARLRVLELEASAMASRAALLPQVTAGLLESYQTSNLQGIGLAGGNIPSRVGPYRLFDARGRVSQSVLDFGLLAGVRAAQARTKQSEADAETVREQTLAAVIDLYLKALEADSRVRATAARIDTAEAVQRQVKDAEEAGKSSKLDVARATERLERERTSLAFARRDRDTLITLLVRAIGWDAAKRVELKDLAQRLPAEARDAAAIAAEAANSRAEIRSLAARRTSLEEERKRARRERWPKVNFAGDFGALGNGPERSLSTWQIGASLTIPLWTSGRIENEAKAARFRLDRQSQDERSLKLDISQEIRSALVEEQAAGAAFRSAAAAAEAARETLELARLRFQAGMTTNLDVTTAQSNLAEAQEEQIRARYQGLLAEAKLARARGDVLTFVTAR